MSRSKPLRETVPATGKSTGEGNESATGSANFFGPALTFAVDAPGRSVSRPLLGSRAVHLRMPSFDRGLTAGLWAITFGVIILFGSIAVGLDKAIAFIVAPLVAAAIYFFIRINGEEPLR